MASLTGRNLHKKKSDLINGKSWKINGTWESVHLYINSPSIHENKVCPPLTLSQIPKSRDFNCSSSQLTGDGQNEGQLVSRHKTIVAETVAHKYINKNSRREQQYSEIINTACNATESDMHAPKNCVKTGSQNGHRNRLKDMQTAVKTDTSMTRLIATRRKVFLRKIHRPLPDGLRRKSGERCQTNVVKMEEGARLNKKN
ncbi:hypothetical protein T265_11644 [Opisthorchis viverrini]|uniref:Uncharacterized protein n=1 Tax=Opisthorchis viverrini TaxID=6198 RepID=A0A074YXW7_OPIVI|nr:hypothetical protein T265_11644 [Opisthorchis viverrini]KER19631.1 hypothetical protein T265_11644 [Opisthorchis viverrini]